MDDKNPGQYCISQFAQKKLRQKANGKNTQKELCQNLLIAVIKV
jgi:hypothetical protein